MNSRGSNNRLNSTAPSFASRLSFLFLSMFATMASFYVAGRLWQDAENRVHMIDELDRRTGQVKSAVSVDDTLKIISCREQQKRLSALQMELEKATQEGFVPKHLSGIRGDQTKKKLLAVIGISTRFGRRNNRDAIRKAWMSQGAASLKKLEENKGIVIRFVIGRSATLGDSSDREIDSENSQSNDFMILEDHREAPEQDSKRVKLFFAHAVDHWDAEFYVKVNDDIYVNIDSLGALLASHLDNPRVYIGCMKSGEVFSQPGHKWYEPEWWKFGDGKSYFRHASGEVVAISQALAQFVSVNRAFLQTYAHDDVSIGSWFLGVNVNHIDEGKFCCSSWSTAAGSICAAA
ncbi:hypothetical protein Leryth_025584 [Lithospermum erythrorhizon]|nr:hypothetical protein Leryth_025584 [Lithospermum erythrorhizon]